MQFIKNLFAKKEPPVEKLVGLEETETWLKAKEKKALVMPEAGQVLEDIRILLTELGDSTKELEEVEVPEDVFPRLKKLGEINRQNMLRHLKEMHKEISPPADCGFHSISKFYKSSAETLKQGTEGSLRSHYYVKALFESEANKVIGDIKRLESLILKLKEPVEETEKLIASIQACSNEISELKSNALKLKEMRASIDSASKKIEEIDHEISELGKKKASLKTGTDWERFESLKRERVMAMKAIEEIDCKSSYFFAPFSKATEKIEKLSISGRYPLLARQKELLSKNFLDYSKEDIKEFTEWLQRLLLDGSLKLKQKAKSRIDEKLPLFKSMLERYQKEHSRFSEKKAGLEISLDACEVSRQVKAIEWKLKKLSKEKDDLSPGKLEQKMQVLTRWISLGEKRLADHVNKVAGKKVELSIGTIKELL